MNKDRLNHVAALLVTLGIGAITEYTNVKHAWWGAVVIGILTNWRLALTGKQAPAGPAGPSVPPVAILLLALPLLSAPNCAGAGVPAPVGPVSSAVVDCAEKATHDAALGLLDDVASALVTSNWTGALTDLAKRWGDAAIACAVAEVSHQSDVKASRTNDDTEKLKAQRGAQWVAAHPVTGV